MIQNRGKYLELKMGHYYTDLSGGLVEVLRGIDMFSSLPESKLMSIATTARIYRYPYRESDTDNRMGIQGESAERVYLVGKGKVGLLCYSKEDNLSYLIRIARGGNWIGIAEAMHGGPINFGYEGIILEDSELISFKRNDFRSMLGSIPAFSFHILRELGEEALEVTLSHSWTEGDVLKRLLNFFILCGPYLWSENSGGERYIHLSHGQLATFTNTSRETTFRCLRPLIEEGSLRFEKGRGSERGNFIIDSPERLKEILESSR
jgi:CRP-like cAMP-binding protein